MTNPPSAQRSVTFVPKLFLTLAGYTREQGIKDVTAIVAGFLVSALGGSRVQIGGPTGAFVVIVSGIVVKHGIDGLIRATFLAGLLMIAMGVAKLGGVIKFVPRPVAIGFTSGIALIIFSTQIKDGLVVCNRSSWCSDPVFGIGVRPADRLTRFVVRADVLHQFAA